MNTSAKIPFRIAFGVLWIVHFGVRLHFQRKIALNQTYTHVNEKKEKHLFGLFAIATLLLPFYFLTSWVDAAHFPLPVWLRWTGCALTGAGIVLFGWAHHALGQSWSDMLALSQKHEWVMNGPYHYVRHPTYTAFSMIGCFLLLSANWLVGVVYIGTLFVMVASRLASKEQMMLDRFGDAYRDYMQKTGCLVPRFRW